MAITVIRVLESELRERFNEASYLTRTLTGEFVSLPFDRQSVYQNPPPGPQEPPGTLTGLIEIINPATNERVALAHRRLRPDGTLGASGKPDPKMVKIGETIYLQMSKRQREMLANLGPVEPTQE